MRPDGCIEFVGGHLHQNGNSDYCATGQERCSGDVATDQTHQSWPIQRANPGTWRIHPSYDFGTEGEIIDRDREGNCGGLPLGQLHLPIGSVEWAYLRIGRLCARSLSATAVASSASALSTETFVIVRTGMSSSWPKRRAISATNSALGRSARSAATRSNPYSSPAELHASSTPSV